MMALLQRVIQARVVIEGQVVGTIGAGLLVLLCAERGDSEVESDKMLTKIIKLRVFSDDAGNYVVPEFMCCRPLSRLSFGDPAPASAT